MGEGEKIEAVGVPWPRGLSAGRDRNGRLAARGRRSERGRGVANVAAGVAGGSCRVPVTLCDGSRDGHHREAPESDSKIRRGRERGLAWHCGHKAL